MYNYSPKDVLKLVKFNAKDNTWKYDANKKDLFSYQAEGVAGILNRFESYGIALLADEVGMGKTIQALAVIAHQFQEKRDANVLVIVPRKEILNQWKNEEYKEFRKNHLLDQDLLPSQDELIELKNLHDGFGLNGRHAQIVFAKTTSFSHIEEGELKKLQEEIASFDLVIIDEAHLYRNDKGDDTDTKRIKNAKKIFGAAQPDTKILLMTATPLHSRNGDVKRVVELFKKEIGKNDEEIMQKIMIRRLRVMTSGVNKYHYRVEEAIPVKLSSDASLRNELFFAMLQKAFISKVPKMDLSKSKHLLDYLEGTNFDTENNGASEPEKILAEVVQKYKEIYKELPSNQKYDEVVKKIEASKEKALVFVRRKASAYELTRRSIEMFDKKAWDKIAGALDIKKPMPENREKFTKIIQQTITQLSPGKLDDFKTKRKVKEFFDEYKALNREFLKGKRRDTIFRDMAENFYSQCNKYSEKDFESFKEYVRENVSQTDVVNDDKIPKSTVLDFFKQKKGEPSTDASRFVLRFNINDDYKSIFSDLLPELLGYETQKAELVKSAVLHASIGVVELYALYLKANRKFTGFKKLIEDGIENDSLKFAREVRDFIEHFDKFEKYLSTNDNAVSLDSDEEEITQKTPITTNMFYNAQPAYPYVSDTKNRYVIARFNSPFFPYVLCGTSILQEGVNLHLFCNKVYHFGSAHTMGDDEQRTGRVDRVMGKMDRELDHEAESKLKIYYPYLEGTFDERNLQKMLTQKRDTELKIDTCQIVSNTQYEDCQRNLYQPIKNLLHQAKKEVETEPYSWELAVSE